MRELQLENELKLGNLMEDSFKEIIKGRVRKKFIEQLENKEFEKIGSPCNSVICCYCYDLKGDR